MARTPSSTRAFRHSGCSDITPSLGVQARPALHHESQQATPTGQSVWWFTLLKDRKVHQLWSLCSRLCKVKSVYLSKLSNRRVIVPEWIKLLLKPKHAHLPPSPLSKTQHNLGAHNWFGDTQTRCFRSLVYRYWTEGAELLHKTIIFVDVTLCSYVM